MHKLAEARDFAEIFRFSGDTPESSSHAPNQLESLRNSLYRHGLEITSGTAPALSRQLSTVYERLKIPYEAINAFVYASPEIQAECFVGSDRECVIRFSSSLVELLDDDEFQFVAGHELGHFLLGHSHITSVDAGIAKFRLQQAREISADRIGFIASGSIENPVRAILKTVSGLSAKHLSFNVGEYLGQLSKIFDGGNQGASISTHPAMVIRCRALLWFSMHERFTGSSSHSSSMDLSKLDKKVYSDLQKDFESHLRIPLERTKADLLLWVAAKEVVLRGAFDKKFQEKISQVLGSEVTEKLRTFLAGLNADEAGKVVDEKLSSSVADLKLLDPDGTEGFVSTARSQIVSATTG